MKRKWKILALVFGTLLIAGGVFGGIRYRQRGIVTVQTGKAVRQDVTSVVTASGEIKPRNYINIGANSMGPARITEILVAEGARVKKRQIVARLESVQAEADVAAQRAAVSSAEADSSAGEAGVLAASQSVETAQAALNRARADLQRTELDFKRAQQLHAATLIAQQEFDQRRAAYEAQKAAVDEAEARLSHARAQRQQVAAQLSATQRRVAQVRAGLKRASDVLDKFTVYSPIEGMVTNLPVRVGETVVPGIQNSPASTIMTIADMSVITSEVKVDETDIVNVKLGQVAEISIDAIPHRTFSGHVIEIGNTAVLRSTGLAASQSAASSQEAKDFKVVIALDAPPEEIRPGLSCTARITTARRGKVVTIPIQSLTVRQKRDLERDANGNPGPLSSASKEEIQGVFVVGGERAQFRKVETGITGLTDIEITSGLHEGDEIVTGSYKVIRTLRNDAKIKVDNRPPVKTGS